MPVATSGDHPLHRSGSLTWESEWSDFGTKTRSYVGESTYSARLKSSLNAGPSTYLNVMCTPSAALACSLHAPCSRVLTLSLPSWDRSGGPVPNPGCGRNRSSEISHETHCWTPRASE